MFGGAKTRGLGQVITKKKGQEKPQEHWTRRFSPPLRAQNILRPLKIRAQVVKSFEIGDLWYL